MDKKTSLLVILGGLGIVGFFFWMKKTFEKTPAANAIKNYSDPEPDSLINMQSYVPEPEPCTFPAYLWGNNGKVVLSIDVTVDEVANFSKGDLLIINDGTSIPYTEPIEIIMKVRGVFPSSTDARESFNLFTNTKYDIAFGRGEDQFFGCGEVTICKLDE